MYMYFTIVQYTTGLDGQWLLIIDGGKWLNVHNTSVLIESLHRLHQRNTLLSSFLLWWRSSITPYAKQNGGKFNFVVEVLKSVPDEEVSWGYMYFED